MHNTYSCIAIAKMLIRASSPSPMRVVVAIALVIGCSWAAALQDDALHYEMNRALWCLASSGQATTFMNRYNQDHSSVKLPALCDEHVGKWCRARFPCDPADSSPNVKLCETLYFQLLPTIGANTVVSGTPRRPFASSPPRHFEVTRCARPSVRSAGASAGGRGLGEAQESVREGLRYTQTLAFADGTETQGWDGQVSWGPCWNWVSSRVTRTTFGSSILYSYALWPTRGRSSWSMH